MCAWVLGAEIFRRIHGKKAFDVLIPESLDSISALMSAMRFLTFTDDWDMDLLFLITIRMKIGSRMAITSASLHSIQNMKIRDPMMVSVEISTSSGP